MNTDFCDIDRSRSESSRLEIENPKETAKEKGVEKNTSSEIIVKNEFKEEIKVRSDAEEKKEARVKELLKLTCELINLDVENPGSRGIIERKESVFEKKPRKITTTLPYSEHLNSYYSKVEYKPPSSVRCFKCYDNHFADQCTPSVPAKVQRYVRNNRPENRTTICSNDVRTIVTCECRSENGLVLGDCISKERNVLTTNNNDNIDNKFSNSENKEKNNRVHHLIRLLGEELKRMPHEELWEAGMKNEVTPKCIINHIVESNKKLFDPYSPFELMRIADRTIEFAKEVVNSSDTNNTFCTEMAVAIDMLIRYEELEIIVIPNNDDETNGNTTDNKK